VAGSILQLRTQQAANQALERSAGQEEPIMATSKLSREMSQERLYSTLLVLGTLVVSALLLYWHVEETHSRFRDNQEALMRQSTEGAARTIALVIESARRSVDLFADKDSAIIAKLAANPEDDEAAMEIKRDLQLAIPENFAYTIGDEFGEVVLADFEGKIGEVCMTDIRQFASGIADQEVFIHPNPLGHHFDIMTNWSHEGRHGVFFVSFSPELIARVLANSELHGHRLMLINRQREGLIEVTSTGARDKLKRKPYLSSEELERIGHRVAVPGTLWELVDLPEEGLYAAHLNEQRTQAVHVFLILLVFAGLMLWLIRREENLRSAAERDLFESHEQLERRVRERTEELSDTNRRLAAEVDRRRSTQQRLSESETRYALASQGSNEGIWEIHFLRDEAYFSPRCRLQLGIDAQAQVGVQAWLERVHPSDRPVLEKALADARSGRTKHIEVALRVRTSDGGWRHLLCRGAVETSDDGRPVRIAGSLTEHDPECEGRDQTAPHAF
jgi:PAS domain-containing protein